MGSGWELFEDMQNMKQVDVGNAELIGINLNHEIFKRSSDLGDENTWE
jgi:hypothetical protein